MNILKETSYNSALEHVKMEKNASESKTDYKHVKNTRLMCGTLIYKNI